jgi:hypothetical protein
MQLLINSLHTTPHNDYGLTGKKSEDLYYLEDESLEKCLNELQRIYCDHEL